MGCEQQYVLLARLRATASNLHHPALFCTCFVYHCSDGITDKQTLFYDCYSKESARMSMHVMFLMLFIVDCRYLGLYRDEVEAAKAYDREAVLRRGIHAVTNFDLSEYLELLGMPRTLLLLIAYLHVSEIRPLCFVSRHVPRMLRESMWSTYTSSAAMHAEFTNDLVNEYCEWRQSI